MLFQPVIHCNASEPAWSEIMTAHFGMNISLCKFTTIFQIPPWKKRRGGGVLSFPAILRRGLHNCHPGDRNRWWPLLWRCRSTLIGQVILVGQTEMSLSIILWQNCSALLYPACKNNNQNAPNVPLHVPFGISKPSNWNFCWMESAHKVLSLIPPSPLLNQSAFANPRSCQ